MLPFDPDELRAFIAENHSNHSADILLRTSPENRDRIKILLGQRESRERLKKKVPEWAERYDLYLPPATNLSQSSSTVLAGHKAGFVSGKVADLTAGSGIDAWQFGLKADELTIVEPNAELLDMTLHNLSALGIEPSSFCMTAGEFLKSNDHRYNWIFLDPSRKSDDGKKTVALHRMEPDLTGIWDELLKRGDRVMVKLSPLFDIKAIVQELPGVTDIDVISKSGEVKEILVRATYGATKPPLISATDLRNGEEQSYRKSYEDILTLSASGEHSWGKYLYDPGAAMIKSGLADTLAAGHALRLPFDHTYLYTSDDLIPSFPGRIFEIMQTGKPYKLKNLPNGLSIVTRNFYDKPDIIRKKLRAGESETDFLFAITDRRKKPVFIHAIKLI